MFNINDKVYIKLWNGMDLGKIGIVSKVYDMDGEVVAILVKVKEDSYYVHLDDDSLDKVMLLKEEE